jgi:predicted small secreted protein
MKTFATLLALSLAFALGACSTMQGFGEDLQKLGNKIENKAASKR